ncbi:rhodanese-like/PpiC domain-containing protein 12, chloroplastic isoform X2 [Salvia splendens]|uniref:rhodanese-like/PpiC domain-containing protein 12, chloroplastic isoform X2 n=1 Tax=Salvia splendens TaxID=180675 RepID=UPI001C27B8FD|nr:rhodanese-like/PpiC domain-containing protein 12, chloroplastic isoform X2 [Salvia splendens]
MLRASSIHLSPFVCLLPKPISALLPALILPSSPLPISHRRTAHSSPIDHHNSVHYFSSNKFLRFPGMSAPVSHLNATASFSTSSSSEAGREILVQHLLVKEDDQKLLLELQKRVAEGEDLSDLAVEHSICPSKEEGGMLGWVTKGQMVPEFEEAAFNAPLNKIVRCKTKFGWHLLQVLSEREESLLEDIQPSELHKKMQDPSFLEEAQLIDVREPDEVAIASLPGFKVLPLRQFGSWGPEVATKFDPEKDTYVMVGAGIYSCLYGSLRLMNIYVLVTVLNSAIMVCGQCKLLNGCRHRVSREYSM